MATGFRRSRGAWVAQLDRTERALIVGLMEQTRGLLAPHLVADGPEPQDEFEALVASLREPVGLADAPATRAGAAAADRTPGRPGDGRGVPAPDRGGPAHP